MEEKNKPTKISNEQKKQDIQKKPETKQNLNESEKKKKVFSQDNVQHLDIINDLKGNGNKK